jgi:predicted DNA-binding protein
MSTMKKRVNITLSPDMEKTLTRLAKRDRVPEAAKVVELLGVALEIEEDVILDSVASKRLKNLKKPLSHKEVWT